MRSPLNTTSVRHQSRSRLGPRPAAADARAAEAAPAPAPAAPATNEASAAAANVDVCHVTTLPPENSLTAAAAALEAAIGAAERRFSAHASGLVRLEVPLPRSLAALTWLQGQTAPGLFPRAFFSPRRSSAPDTDGSAAAGAASAGAGSVAGAGAAWLWKGASGEALDGRVMASMRRFLGADSPRVRVFGGSRFDPEAAPAPEWAEFGSYCFVLPRLEVAEFAGSSLLAVTLAWDGRGAAAAAAEGFRSLSDAAAAAVLALRSMAPPAAPSAAATRLTHLSSAHTPGEGEWAQRLEAVHSQLVPAVPTPDGGSTNDLNNRGSTSNSSVGPPPLKIDPGAALEEYLRNGQQGLDDLLAALDSGFEAVVAVSSADSSDGDDEAGSGNGRDSVFGAATVAGDSGYDGGLQVPGDSGEAEDTFSSSSKARKGMTKVVLARRTDITVAGRLDSLALLAALQERDPRAYQVLLQLPSGTAFLASTPECLYARSGDAVASEAVAGTRARGPGGDVEKDFWLSFDLLRSQKDDVEFGVVRDWVRRALSAVCDDVTVEVAKSVLKQGSVQHLYGKLAGTLRPGADDAALLAALHPTPAVCGQPRGDALRMLGSVEPFDRGFYSGPFGWVSRDAAEFVVAIRSALVRPQSAAGNGNGNGNGVSSSADAIHDVSLFAGVGIVRGSDTASEWAELNLKVSQFERLLAPAPPLASAPNVSALWARAMVEELCRLGCNTFCVAPGSRSSPLTAAAAAHPRARLVPCIDERSLGFWAVGYGRAKGLPAVVITSSGTAVANLLPSVVEAAQSRVPLLLLTADRPKELRGTGANQTIDQVGIFGGYAKEMWDLEAPAEGMAVRDVAERVDAAVAAAVASPAGPVHLNCQFRDPLIPTPAPFDAQGCLDGMGEWEGSGVPAAPAALPSASALDALAPAIHVLSRIDNRLTEISVAPDYMAETLKQGGAPARRGLLVVGELIRPEDTAAAVQLAQLLGWPVVADVLSGLRVGSAPPPGAALPLITHFDHLLLDPDHWEALKPDVVLHLGGHLVSKRLAQFLEWSATGGGGEGSARTKWIFADTVPLKDDQGPHVTHRVRATVPALLASLSQAPLYKGNRASAAAAPEQQAFTDLLLALDYRANAAVDAALEQFGELTEPAVARVLSRELPPGEGLFIGNSMPIRDLDMYGLPSSPSPANFSTNGNGAAPSPPLQAQGAVASGIGAPVGANRGASGIDGVLSTAAGFADGLQRGTTLVIGDLSFLHDVNGLNLLRSGEMRPPLTVVLVNNGGGGIFSFLPIASAVPDDVFTPLWATPQNVDLAGMCRAHGIPHIRVASPEELRTALRSAWALNRHSVIEAVTDRCSNVERHKEVQAAVQRAVEEELRARGVDFREQRRRAAGVTARVPRLSGASCARFNLPLRRPLTTAVAADGARNPTRSGIFIILEISLPDGGGTARVAGEASPLPGLHTETLAEVEAQIQLISGLIDAYQPALPPSAAALDAWLLGTLGVDPAALVPSVRFAVECAVLSAVAQVQNVSLAQVLSPVETESSAPTASAAAVNAMVDPRGDPERAAALTAAAVAAHGPTACIKIKVGRVADPAADAAAVAAARAAAGPTATLRADANRAWTLDQAIEFGAKVQNAHLQYIEEPLAEPTAESVAAFYTATGLAIALDESVDEGLFGLNGDFTDVTLPPGVTALVLKPSLLGGLQRAGALAAAAAAAGATAVISSAFESPLGLLHLAHLVAAVDPAGYAHHGLGTGEWWELKRQDPAVAALAETLVRPPSPSKNGPQRFAYLLIDDLRALAPTERPTVIESAESGPVVKALTAEVETAAGTYAFRILEVSPTENASALPSIVFLHGFMGQPEEWSPLMSAVAAGTGRRCLAVALPGHGSAVVPSGDELEAFSLEAVADAVAAALPALGAASGATLVGYSMGARVALALVARHPGAAFSKFIAVSGSPGLEDPAARAARAAEDASRAAALRRDGLPAFMEGWYRAPLWDSFRAREGLFEAAVDARKRALEGMEPGLAAAIEAASPGLAAPLTAALAAQAAAGELPEVLLVAGEEDAKFVGSNAALEAALGGRACCAMVPGCGHAVHLEAPVQLLNLITEVI